ncbi:hypothetical protein [Paludisphaera mucosa]|uniref:Uncharacterized protein n=1 Tax=Paludisphaera mucosa TaxID=3030827 RepID=A0ABT6F8W5_9BACT|nr:hypothetical protein [Paludisphaera mucosa]MDG3004017.1 hypothetical protein [Paludisphaera mucosa]
MRIPPRRSRRRGLTSVAVLVLLFVIALVGASLVRLSVTFRDRARAHDRSLQSELLADAGLDRAFARLSAAPGYTGERWEIPAEALGAASGAGPGTAALVTIRVETASPGGGARTVRVQADYPPDPPRRVRSSREVVLSDTP